MTGYENSERYVVITADAHAGADLQDYKSYLAKEWHEEFDAWAESFENPYGDRLLSAEPTCNWDSELRFSRLEADGIVAEVIFPNTVPPFYPHSSLMVPPNPESRTEYERRWAGLQAHNRWLAEFCAETPGRRAGVAQVMLNNIEDAVAEVRWLKNVGLTGGILLPGITPGSSLPGIWHERYEPIWQVCEELRVPIHHHAGGGGGDYGFDPVSLTIFHIESHWFSYRAIWHLMFAGVFERHPDLVYVMTEAGAGWVPGVFEALDGLWVRYNDSNSSGGFFGNTAARAMRSTPSEYFARNCYLGASFLHPKEAAIRDSIGVNKIMWGSDFPHIEGSYPYTTAALRASFASVPQDEVRLMLSETAAEVYGFDLELLAPLAAKFGPLIAEVSVPLREEERPADSACLALDRNRPLRYV